ncbi:MULTISPECIES: DUF4404 family protein [unclassified Motilimonas]|uniref:DUF4404 family protein n=1 Tax=Motilimonas TaxID=1914248 RepID=UPI001E47564C|nr:MULTISPECIES: DUF4404 family protein [unclassified Motilimonas]MCE0557041.1 DUF4404 family protein [Motilimonas sp. E26]MDO6524275.1 DUF4404 family protein [Motilimonas sp. 1_MG-2023]
MKQKLTQDLEQLDQAIKQAFPADECTAANLRQVADEISLAIQTGHSPQQQVEEQLEVELLNFEQAHPQLSQAIRNLMNTLSGMGI